MLRGVSVGLGRLIVLGSPRRRHLLYGNLHHAFRDRPGEWREKIARASSERLVETALLSLASPYLSEARMRVIARLSPSVEASFREHHAQPHPLVVATPHLAYWESLTWLGLYLSHALPEFGVIFRPLDNPTADAWVKKTRERHGMRLLSRKQGLQEAFKILRRNGVVGMLFDQNAGLQGALTTLFGRVCSTSELTGLFAEKYGATIAPFYPRRLGFWRMQFELEKLSHDGTSEGATIALNRWLEQTLSSDDNLCASWLWSHDRWRNQDMPSKRFRLEAKRDFLAAEMAARGTNTLPRKTRFWIRLPNWLGDVVMTLPLLRALRQGRPDAEITLVARPGHRPLLEVAGVADRIEDLPPRGWGYFFHFRRLRREHADTFVLFTNSVRGDVEARLTGVRQRFGVVRHGRRRPLLSASYHVQADFHEREHHQLELWENFFRHFGLEAALDRTPLGASVATGASTQEGLRIGFIAGSENNPEKRWPAAHWRTLAASLLQRASEIEIVLFGTAKDQPITESIHQGLGEKVHDLAGRTDLRAYMHELSRCRLVVTNDTGGMHLANALGVPVVALFGPTNPVRTGPVFAAPVEIVQPPGCPSTGGGDLAAVTPDRVLAAVEKFADTLSLRR